MLPDNILFICGANFKIFRDKISITGLMQCKNMYIQLFHLVNIFHLQYIDMWK